MQLQLYLTSLHLGEINVKAQTKKNSFFLCSQIFRRLYFMCQSLLTLLNFVPKQRQSEYVKAKLI